MKPGLLNLLLIVSLMIPLNPGHPLPNSPRLGAVASPIETAPSAPAIPSLAFPASISISAAAITPTEMITFTINGFAPSILTTTVGTQIVWLNATSQTHVLHSGIPQRLYLPLITRSANPIQRAAVLPSEYRPQLFTTEEVFSATISPGATYTHTFSMEGAFAYYMTTAPQFGGQVVAQTGLPPDPATIASPIDQSVPTDFADATAFLYSGPHPIQTGVVSGTLEKRRVAVLRGRVVTDDGAALSGVAISVLDHPEFGQTFTRLDGAFDLAVNGGDLLTLNYTRIDYLPVQRQIEVPWRDYTWLPDVVLIQPDPIVTPIDLTANEPVQVVRGSVISDTDGVRQETLLFPQGTSAVMTLTNGTTQTLSALNVRATEFTVGDNGPAAMPGDLPANSAYTYAFELSVDEASNAGAQDVGFNQPVAIYNENFLGFPAGITVPVGYYDQGRGLWLPSQSGLVIGVLTITNGLAELDVDGSGTPATSQMLATLGITDTERASLAQLYTPGQSLWRIQVQHFSKWDANWGARCKNNDCVTPNGADPVFGGVLPDPTCQAGSVIECQNQLLGEQISIVGTPYTLNYRSDRVPGYRAKYAVDIPLSGATIHPLVKRIDLDVVVAGVHHTQSFPALPNQQTRFVWDGRDAYGRILQGAQPTQVRVGWVYELEYIRTDRFGYNGNGIPITGDRARDEFTLWRYSDVTLGGWQFPPDDLGGWTLSAQQTYDPISHLLYKGDGTKYTAGHPIVETVPGTSRGTYSEYIAIGPDGSLYQFDNTGRVVRRISPNGDNSVIAGTGALCTPDTDPCGDGGLATQARMGQVKGLAVGPDGSVYLADWAINRVRRISPDGIITTIAGTGVSGTTGDGGTATQAHLQELGAIVVGPDGSVYVGQEANNFRIRRIGPDGIITTFAGGGSVTNVTPVITATAAAVIPRGMAMGLDGSLYLISQTGGSPRVRKVRMDGMIETIAGTGGNTQALGDGGPALQAGFNAPTGLAIASDGSLYVADTGNNRIRHIGPDGIISTVAGNGQNCITPETSACGAGGPALQAPMQPYGLVINPRKELYFSNANSTRIRLIQPALPSLSSDQMYFASEDGQEVHIFDNAWRHLQTVDARTGAIHYQLNHDSAGRLLSITDGDGRVTTVERNANGLPTAIVGPYGQRTNLTLDANGYLAAVTNPAGEPISTSMTFDGLLIGMTSPRGFTSQYSYDSLGRLVHDDDPAGGFKALTKVQNQQDYTVTLTTALSRTTQYVVDELPTGAQRRITIDPASLKQQLVKGTDDSRFTTFASGAVLSFTLGPDPRFAMQSPLAKTSTYTTPGGLANNLAEQRSAALADPFNPLSVLTLTEQVAINGRAYNSVYISTTRRITDTTPQGRPIVTTIDNQSRPLQVQVAGLLPVNLSYDAHGRLSTLSQGTRIISVTYNSAGYTDIITDPLGRTITFAYDAAGRVLSQTMPGGRTVGFAYDANSNLTALTPPGQPQHNFSYTPIDRVAAYVPPNVGAGSNQTQYTYNLDRQVTQVDPPDGQTIGVIYDPAGRPQTITLPERTITYAYHPTTGNLNTIVVSGSESLAYTFDGSLLKTESWSGPVSGTISRTYDNNLRVTSRSVNGANAIPFQYDNDSLLTQAGALSLAYHPQSGFLTSTALMSVSTVYGYNGYGELITHTASFTTTSLQQVQLTRDNLGRITGKTEVIGGSTTVYSYTYDVAGRLASEIVDGVTTASYAYDLNGNRLSVVRPSGAITATYDHQDRLLQYGTTVYTYTANGELASKITPSQTTTYTYDALGNLTAVGLPGGTQIAYVIDGRNRRVGRKVNGVLTQGWLYQDQLKPIAELDGSGNVVARFVYATFDNVPDYMVKGGVTYRLLTDHLGSVRLVVDAATGQIAQRMDYDAFGRVLTDTNPGFQPFGFAGGLYDTATGLVRFGARDYDAEVGRWTAKDPIGFEGYGFNLYLYTQGDPVNLSDSIGLWSNKAFTSAVVGGTATGCIAAEATLGISCLAGGVLGAFAYSLDQTVEAIWDLVSPDDCELFPSDFFGHLETIREEQRRGYEIKRGLEEKYGPNWATDYFQRLGLRPGYLKVDPNFDPMKRRWH